MIEDRELILQRLSSFSLSPAESTFPYFFRTNLLRAEIKEAVKSYLVPFQKEVHLALSGGVDSTVLLYTLREVANGRTIIPHCIYSNDDSKDLSYARAVCSAVGLPLHAHSFSDTGEDKYKSLYELVSRETNVILSGDCINELLGGYYKHMSDPSAYSSFLEALPTAHLEPMQEWSNKYGVRVLLPYATSRVMEAASSFTPAECYGPERRKDPMYSIAKSMGVPADILERKKMGLCSA